MALMRHPRCPVCRNRVSLDSIWEMTPVNHMGLLQYSSGIVCPGCGTKLRIVQRYSAIAVSCLWIGVGLLASVSSKYLTANRALFWPAVLLLTVTGIYLTIAVARQFVTLKVRTGTDTVDFPLERLRQQLEAKAHGDETEQFRV